MKSGDEKLKLGVTVGNMILLTEYAESIGADNQKLKRQAQRCRALEDAGGVLYIDIQKFFVGQQALRLKREARKKLRASTKKSESLSTTKNIGILRGQRTRLTNLNRNLENEIALQDKKIPTVKNKIEKRDLETERGKLIERLDSNKTTLQIAIDRLGFLESGRQHDSSGKKNK